MNDLTRRGFGASIICVSTLAATGLPTASLPALPATFSVALRSVESGLFARAGEITYCARGCELGTITRDILVGDMADPSDFRLVPGMSIGVEECPFCKAHAGGYYFKT